MVFILAALPLMASAQTLTPVGIAKPEQTVFVAPKTPLTDKQIVEGIPASIVKPIGRVVDFDDDNILIMRDSNGMYKIALDNPSVRIPFKEKKFQPVPELVEGWQNPTYSPDSTKIAYTFNNDLYSIDVKTKKITRHTFDGSELILNGYASWVYYEEILGRPSRYRAFWWSPDSKVLAFYRFDNTKVAMFPIYLPDGQYGYLNETRYPKAGDANPEVKIGFVSAGGGETVWADFNEKDDQYFGIPFWNGDGSRMIVCWMDRSQDNFKMYSVSPMTGSKLEIYSEHQKSWVDWPEEMLFTKDGFYFVRDYTMWEQIYYLSYDGSKRETITDGANYWGTSLLKVDKKHLFFVSRGQSSTRRDIYRANLSNGKIERISYDDYDFTNVKVSPDGLRISAVVSNHKTPPQNVIINLPKFFNIDKKTVTVLEDSKGADFDKYDIALPELVYVKMRDGSKVPAQVIWPIGMDRSGNTKYPVKVDIYGGPNSQQVYDTWRGVTFNNQWWANHGVIQVVLDTRSAGHLGKAGLNTIYRYLSVHELEDFIDGIKYFTALPYVNKEKVGIEGYSFGGTMALLAVTEGNEYFQYGIASAGVMDWRLYDTHYAERYMDTPADNPDGYDKSMAFNRLENYRGDKTNMLRLTHGTGDDNVHLQNSLQVINKLEELNKDFELMIYPGGMHGYRGAQQRHYQMQNYRFWYEYLLEQELPEILRER